MTAHEIVGKVLLWVSLSTILIVVPGSFFAVIGTSCFLIFLLLSIPFGFETLISAVFPASTIGAWMNAHPILAWLCATGVWIGFITYCFWETSSGSDDRAN